MCHLKRLLIILPFTLFVGCSDQGAAPSSGQAKAGGAAQARSKPKVTVATVTQRSVPIYASYVGRTEAIQTVEVRARAEGILKERRFTEGSDVMKGEILFIIDPQQYQNALESARADLARAKATSDHARENVRRLRPLVEQRAVNRQQLDDGLATEKEAAAMARSAEVAVRDAQLNLGYTTVTSPISGRIGFTAVNIGSLVGKGQPTLLATVSQLTPIYVEFSIPEREYLQRAKASLTDRSGTSKPDAPSVNLILADDSEYHSAGRLKPPDRAVDPETGTLRMRAEFPNPERLLLPNQYAKVRLLVTEKRNAILIPEQAVQSGQTGQSVLVVNDKDEIERRSIVTAQRQGHQWIVEQGLSAGERVVIEGLQTVRPGTGVTPVPQDEADETDDSPKSSNRSGDT